ncbi:MAG: hypothetical protein GEU28_02800 [Dehalococcoidia bacterium]|nr:hypothetical protein [Dehalococcoidia bacterium]
MKQWSIAVALLAATAVIQAYALTYFRVADVRFDLMMALLIAWAFTRGIEEAMVVVPLGGFMVSFFSQEPLGASVLGYAAIVPLATLRDLRFVEYESLVAAAVALAATFVQTIIYLVVLRGTGLSPDWSRGLIEVAIPAAFMNMVAAPLAIAVFKRATSERRTYGAGPATAYRRTGRRLELP